MKLFNYLIFLPFYINPETLSIVSVSHGVSGVPIGWVIILFYFLSSIGAKNISKVLNGVVKEHSIESLIFLVLMVLVSAISIISSSYKIFQLTAFIGLTMVILFNINIRYLCLDKAMSGLILFVILHFFSLLLNTNSPPNFIFNDTLIHGARSSYIVIISFLLVYLFSKLADGGVIFFKTIIISCTLYVGYRLGVDALLVFILIFIPWLVIFTIIKSPHNKAVYVYLTSIIFIVIPAVSVLFFYAISEFINLYDAINIRIRVWIEHIVKIDVVPIHYNGGSAHNFVIDIFKSAGYIFGIFILVGSFYLALSILNKVVFCIKKSPIVIDKEVILFVGLLLVIAVQNTVNSGLSQLIPLLFFIVISNQVMKKMDRMSRI